MSAPAAEPTVAAFDLMAKTLIDGILQQSLTQQEHIILIRYFGLDGVAPASLEMLADQLDQEKSDLSQSVEHILGKLRHATLDMAVPQVSLTL